jgi:uncharacterized protein
MTPTFTPVSALIGGALIGVATTLLLLLNGRVAGIQGMVAGLARGAAGDAGFRAWFLLGLLAAGAVGVVFAPASLALGPRPLWALGLAGVLVGAGTRLANGCTSGHGVCGVSRGSPRSLVATATFVACGIVTVALLRAWGGAG